LRQSDGSLPAIVFLLAIVTKATTNKAGTTTINTSIIDIIVGKYNILFIIS